MESVSYCPPFPDERVGPERVAHWGQGRLPGAYPARPGSGTLLAMKPSLLRRVVPVLVLLLAAPCLGWGADGHRIVGEIASHHLTPEARAGVQVLLGDQSLADVGTWADEVRSQPEYQWTRPLHYANVKPEGTEFDLNRDCPEEGCVVSAIIRFTEVLQDREASTAEKTEALNFVLLTNGSRLRGSV